MSMFAQSSSVRNVGSWNLMETREQGGGGDRAGLEQSDPFPSPRPMSLSIEELSPTWATDFPDIWSSNVPPRDLCLENTVPGRHFNTESGLFGAGANLKEEKGKKEHIVIWQLDESKSKEINIVSVRETCKEAQFHTLWYWRWGNLSKEQFRGCGSGTVGLPGPFPGPGYGPSREKES